MPDEATVREGGTVTFNVNGGGHGIAVYLSARTPREKTFRKTLCQGGAGVCNATTGTANLAYDIVDRHAPSHHRDRYGRESTAHRRSVPRFLSTSGQFPVSR